uniref:Coiled-coil domain containing 169 n=1 Tax=Sinocyclocheilus anshuiensis TaxID=1608454 RepID=A0A671P929_9TELE
MLKDSVSDLRSTLADLEKRQHSVDGEENEWRTRYETQLELNEQLEKQISVVQERLETLRGDPSGSIRNASFSLLLLLLLKSLNIFLAIIVLLESYTSSVQNFQKTKVKKKPKQQMLPHVF